MRLLLAQHPRQLTPIRCAPSTIAQLHRYFEEVVLENSLGALVIESLPQIAERSARETTRVRDLVHSCEERFLVCRRRRCPVAIDVDERQSEPRGDCARATA